MTPERAETIIQAYGAILETRAPSPGCVADVTKLPFSKQEIKDALVLGLKTTTNPQTRDLLKIGCIHLPDWQDGVGEEDQGLDPSKLDLHADPSTPLISKLRSRRTAEY